MAQCQICLEAFFICNNVNKNINKIFHTYLSLFQNVIFFFQISARSSWKKFKTEKWPKAGYLPLRLFWSLYRDKNAQYKKVCV